MLAEAKVVALLATHSDGEVIENHTALFANEAEPEPSPTPPGRERPGRDGFQDKDAFEEDAEELDDLFLGDAEVWRRGASPARTRAVVRTGRQPLRHADHRGPVLQRPAGETTEPVGSWVRAGEPAPRRASRRNSRGPTRRRARDGARADAAYVGETAADGVVTAREIGG